MVGVALGREVEAGAGAGIFVGDGASDPMAVATAARGSSGAGVRCHILGRADVIMGVATRKVVGVPLLARERDSGCRGDLFSAMGRGKRQGERRSDSIPGRGWQRRFGHSDKRGVPHDNKANMATLADTTVRALAKL